MPAHCSARPIHCVTSRHYWSCPTRHSIGFMIFNDWSARDLQFDEMQGRLGPAKGKDGATSIGPWLVTTDEMAPYLKDGRLNVRCTALVNGEIWSESQGGDASHSWGAMIE